MIYDSARGRAVLFGGSVFDGGVSTRNDTWTFDGREWRKLATRGSSPADRDRAKMVFDEGRGIAVLFGGQRPGLVGWSRLADTWRLEDDKWTRAWTWLRRTPPGRCGHMMAYDRAGHQTVMFGGAANIGVSRADTWVFDGSTWKFLPIHGPQARRYAEFDWDDNLGGCVLYGGCVDDFGAVPLTDCWLFRENRWEFLPWASNFAVRDDGAMLFNPKLRRLIMLAAEDPREGTAVLTQDGWRTGLDIDPPSPRQCYAAAYLPREDAILVCGGEEVGTEDRFGETYLVRCSEAF